MTRRQTVALWMVAVGLVLASLTIVLAIRPSDVGEYARYAQGALLPPLFTHWPVEYPALSEAVFLIPRLLPLPYNWAFGIVAGGGFLSLIGIRRYDPPWQVRSLLYFGLGALGVLVGRYDIFAVLAATIGIEAARRDRMGWAWFWMAIGFLLKLYPAVFFPVLFVWEYRRRGRWPWQALCLTALSVALVLVVEYRWAGPGALSPYKFFGHRPFELGSLPGDVAALLDPWHTRIAFGFGSMNILSPLSGVVGALFDALMALGFLAVLWGVYTGALTVTEASLLALSVLLLTSKVFSVQFMMWLFPLWSYFRLNRPWLLAAGFSSLAYPAAYIYATYHPFWWGLLIALFFVRSIFLVWGTARALADRLPANASPKAPSP